MGDYFAIGLSKKAIFERIRLFTSYLAAKRASDAAGYDKVAAIDLDLPLLTFIADDSASLLAASLGDRVSSVEFDGDIIRFTLLSPGAKCDQRIIYKLIESYIVAVTIVDWLRIVGYDFSEGAASAMKSAETVAANKLSLLLMALTPEVAAVVHKGRASRRRIPPM